MYLGGTRDPNVYAGYCIKLYWPGVTPKTFLKIRPICDWSVNPHVTATSAGGIHSTSNFAASRALICILHSCGDRP